MKVAIIGGGAAGFFSAISVKEHYPDAEVVIFEKSDTLLSKVKISGGGRCNVTNNCASISQLSQHYPRGGKALKKAFRIFNNSHTMRWFESRGVPLVIQNDNCVFPVSQDSQSIIDCFLEQTKKLSITINIDSEVITLKKVDNKLNIKFADSLVLSRTFDKVIIATGGSPTRSGLNWIETLGHKIEDPIPSLFTFNLPQEAITRLMGIVVENARVSLQGSKLNYSGPLLITHWGMSGPVILKLSAFGARFLHKHGYECKVQVNWVNIRNKNTVMDMLTTITDEHAQKNVSTIRPFLLPTRLWFFLLEKAEILPQKKWRDLGKKGLNKLVSLLTNDMYSVKGKTTFREEFVTCGGVSPESINMNTMESKVCENLYFAGEVMDIDGITGGFNLQAAWTTGFIAGKLE